MSGYTRMVLVRPDMVKSETETNKPQPSHSTDAQAEYYETQLARERLSPESSIISVLVHLQKKANSVLHDPSLTTNSKLSQYNQLMTRSSILMNKAKAVSKAVPLGNYGPLRRVDSSEAEDEDDVMSVTSDTPTTTPLTTRTLPPYKASETGLDAEIRHRIPISYQHDARKLYRLLAKDGRGALNWNSEGELVIGEKTIRGTDIVDLLADAARPKSKAKAPVGRGLFAKIVKTINPKLRHVKNRAVFETGLSKAQKLKKKAQTGSALKKHITWHTRL